MTPEKKIQWNPSKYCKYSYAYCYNTPAERTTGKQLYEVISWH
jgi:hypothetical protein